MFLPIVLLSVITSSNALASSPIFRIREIRNNPGLIYETLDPIRFTNNMVEIRQCQQYSIFFYNDIIDADRASKKIQEMCNDGFQSGGIFKVYRMHSLHAPQDEEFSTKGYAYVKPKKLFLAVSFSKNKYFMFDELNFENCYHLQIGVTCMINEEFNIIDEKTDPCEIRLLDQDWRKSLSNSYKNCDIQIDKNGQSEWNYLELTRGWLYSTEFIQPLTIRCLDGRTTETVIYGNGILELQPQCSAKTSRTELPASLKQWPPEAIVRIYVPLGDLNLHELSKIHYFHPWNKLDDVMFLEGNDTKLVKL